MHETTDRWLEERVRPPKRVGRSVLVLCRSRATLSLVRRWIASRGGMLGVDVATPSGLAVQARQRPLLAGAPDEVEPLGAVLPEGTAIADRVGSRPGLTAHARRWVQALRAVRLAGDTPDVPAWLDELEATGWGEDDDLEAMADLLALAREHGAHLSSGYHWDRVVLLGFDGPPGAVEPLDRAIATALGGELPDPEVPEAEALPSLEVPDVGAEARTAARLATDDPDGTVILVADEATARRVRAALHRNGLPCALRERRALQVHQLASIVRRCAEWLTDDTDPHVRVGDLAAVLAGSSLGRSLHPAAEAWLDARLAERGLTRDDAHLSRQGVVKVLQEARLLDVPLSRWITRLEDELGSFTESETEAEPDEHTRRRVGRSLAIAARLRLLEAVVVGVPVDTHLSDVSGAALQFDDDDFEAMVAELLGEEALEPEAPQTGTLGALQGFLVALRVRVHDDPVARAILGALKARADWAASPAHVHQALGGAVDPGVLTDGVDVLSYDDYDGRPARRLVLLDVHDKGLSRRPVPDPLLTDDDIAALGVRSGRAVVDFRLQQAWRAARAAETVCAVLARRDPGGRDVVAPIQLELVPIEASPGSTPSYGLGLTDLPEAGALSRLQIVHGGAAEAPEHTDGRLRHLATQATVEWIRAGRGRRPADDAPALPDQPTLLDHLHRARPIGPRWALPWLGHAEGVPEARLGDGPHSPTGTLTELSHCLYQAFVRRVLRVREPEELSEELDPREVGNAVHDALEQAGRSPSWPPRQGDPDALIHDLKQHTKTTFKEQVDKLGALSEPRKESIRGRVRRWNEHWTAWVTSRAERSRDGRDYMVSKMLRLHPVGLRAHAVLLHEIPAAADTLDWQVWAWLTEVGGVPPDRVATLSPDVLLAFQGGRRRVPDSWLPDLPRFLEDPAFEALHATVLALRSHFDARNARTQAVVAELPFGAWEPDADPVPLVEVGADPEAERTMLAAHEVSLALGRAPLAVRGRIDRLELRGGADRRWLVLTDVKTGRALDDWLFRYKQQRLDDPQLAVYALVVRELQRAGLLPEPLASAPLALIEWDQVKRTFQEPMHRDTVDVPATYILIDDAWLDGVAATLGALVDSGRAGRWTLHPHPRTCPALNDYGHDYCPYAAACRLRALPEEGP